MRTLSRYFSSTVATVLRSFALKARRASSNSASPSFSSNLARCTGFVSCSRRACISPSLSAAAAAPTQHIIAAPNHIPQPTRRTIILTFYALTPCATLCCAPALARPGQRSAPDPESRISGKPPALASADSAYRSRALAQTMARAQASPFLQFHPALLAWTHNLQKDSKTCSNPSSTPDSSRPIAKSSSALSAHPENLVFVDKCAQARRAIAHLAAKARSPCSA